MTEKKPEDLKKVMRQPSELMQTSKGQVEYAFYGEGPTLLSIHGGPGGYDQGLLLGEIFRLAGFRILSISRAGYLRSSVETGRTFEEQADTISELLDKLGLDKVLLTHASAGGPAGYTFTNKYTNRVLAQVAIDSVCLKYVVEVTKAEEAMFLSKFGLWLTGFVTEHFPKMVIDQLLQTESTLSHPEIEKIVKEIMKDPYKIEMIKSLTQTMEADRFAERKPGLDNDLKLLAGIDKLPLDKITCPTLIIHGDSDKDVHPEDAEYANKSIAGSELYWIPKGSHLGFWTADKSEEAQEKAVDFLKSYVTAKA